MSTKHNDMVSLLKRQEQDRSDLAAGAYDAWQSVKETEKQLLAPYDGYQEHAPQEIKDTLLKGREAFFKEWRSDGRLAAVMSERHEKERIVLVKRQQILDGIRQSQQRSKQKDQER